MYYRAITLSKYGFPKDKKAAKQHILSDPTMTFLKLYTIFANELKLLFLKIDSDKDGKITLKEFKEMVAKITKCDDI